MLRRIIQFVGFEFEIGATGKGWPVFVYGNFLCHVQRVQPNGPQSPPVPRQTANGHWLSRG